MQVPNLESNERVCSSCVQATQTAVHHHSPRAPTARRAPLGAAPLSAENTRSPAAGAFSSATARVSASRTREDSASGEVFHFSAYLYKVAISLLYTACSDLTSTRARPFRVQLSTPSSLQPAWTSARVPSSDSAGAFAPVQVRSAAPLPETEWWLAAAAGRPQQRGKATARPHRPRAAPRAGRTTWMPTFPRFCARPICSGAADSRTKSKKVLAQPPRRRTGERQHDAATRAGVLDKIR